MILNSVTPTKTNSWKKLNTHYKSISQLTIKELFKKNPNRKEELSLFFNDFNLDFSKNRITTETLGLLSELAEEKGLSDAIEACFTGKEINHTEKQAVLHTALRYSGDAEILVGGQNVVPKIKTVLRKISAFSNKIISGKWKGYTNKNITDIVNIGIGGSNEGPQMVIEALHHYRNHLNIHFVSNIDGDSVKNIIDKLNPETTIFLIVSKSFETAETIINAETIKNWFLKEASIFDVSKHFVAVTNNVKLAEAFGLDKKYIFPIWDWVGGRFSLWSGVGLSIALAIGFKNFKDLLAGAEEMDIHFRKTPFNKNIPVVMALISVWYRNFYRTETEVVIPYSESFSLFVPYLQQLFMESNGKTVDRNGDYINYNTSPIVWGGIGTSSQHSFMQLLHQGSVIAPADFIAFKIPNHNLYNHHEKLLSNFSAQTQALAFGKTVEQVHLDMKISNESSEISELLPFKVFEGNKPSTSIVIETLTPRNLGSLLALYEHKVFVQGVIWNINSFDQFGVELGKELAK